MGSTISSSTELNNTVLNDGTYNWPITVEGGTENEYVIIKFTDNIILEGSNKYFIIKSNYIKFDGSVSDILGERITITISNTIDYRGLFSNGYYDFESGYIEEGYGGIEITNLIINAESSTLKEGSGWICQEFYSLNAILNSVSFCSVNAPLTNIECGGICGRYAGMSGLLFFAFCNFNGTIESTADRCGGILGPYYSASGISLMIYCETSTILSANNCGGMCGPYLNPNVIPITLFETFIYGCSYNGNITGSGCGGLAAGYAGNTFISSNPQYASIIYIQKCKSNAVISGIGSGGIAGSYFGYGIRPEISNCEVYGLIEGVGAGGIVGSFSAYTDGSVRIENSYFIGNINGENSGGIVGYGSSSNLTEFSFLPQTQIYNCYHVGTKSGEGSGGILGSNCSAFCFDCYSLGDINGTNAGGIAGVNSGYDAIKINQPNTSVLNFCYTQGNILSSTAGGICGPNSSELVFLYNDYYTGNLISGYPIIAQPANGFSLNCYSSGEFSGPDASKILIGDPLYNSKKILVSPVGVVWIQTSSTDYSIPWILSSFSKSYYQIDEPPLISQSTKSTTSTKSTQSVSPLVPNNPQPYESIFPNQSTTIPALTGLGIIYSIVGIGQSGVVYVPEKFPSITINSETGIISTTYDTRPSYYQIYVYFQNLNNFGYSVSVFYLNVKSLGVINSKRYIQCENKLNCCEKYSK
jgi:hypothetical protein